MRFQIYYQPTGKHLGVFEAESAIDAIMMASEDFPDYSSEGIKCAPAIEIPELSGAADDADFVDAETAFEKLVYEGIATWRSVEPSISDKDLEERASLNYGDLSVFRSAPADSYLMLLDPAAYSYTTHMVIPALGADAAEKVEAWARSEFDKRGAHVAQGYSKIFWFKNSGK